MNIAVLLYFVLALLAAFVPATTAGEADETSSVTSSMESSFKLRSRVRSLVTSPTTKPFAPTLRPTTRKPTTNPTKAISTPVPTKKSPPPTQKPITPTLKPTTASLCNITVGGYACLYGFGFVCRRRRNLQLLPTDNCTQFKIGFNYYVSYANSNPVEYVTSLIGEKGTNLVTPAPVNITATRGARFAESYAFDVCKGLSRSFKVTVTAQTVPVLAKPAVAGTTCSATTTITFNIPPQTP